nr:xyloglucan endotransglycoslase/hydrolase1 [Dioscorea oppositifolia]
MASSSSSLLTLFSLLCFMSFSNGFTSTNILDNIQTVSFDEGYTQLFGDTNLMLLSDGKSVHLSLDQRTGAGFASQDLYLHGFFSASIKLPSDYAAGVVVAFYMTNGDLFEKNHDELDFEFLGNVRGKEWRVQTNVYGNGSTAVGREERYGLWFDPTEAFHHYSILWNHDQIIFYIDDIPIREIIRNESSMGGAFPSKPMSLYATIWDGSNWATSGGRYKVNYKFSPYIAKFSDFVLHGCAVNPVDHSSACDKAESNNYNTISLSTKQKYAMQSFRNKYMSYSYCYDRKRYAKPLKECSSNRRESLKSYRSNGVKLSKRHRHGAGNSAI